MYATTRIRGGNGLGEALPVACTGSSCYATSPAAEQSLQALQDLLNRFASTVGAQPLTPDYANGKRVALIGPATLALAQKVAQYLATLYRQADTMTLLGMVGNVQDLAKFGSSFAQIAAPYAKGMSAPPAPKPTSTTTTTPAQLPPTGMLTPPPFAPPPSPHRNLYIVAGVVAVIGLGVTAYLLLKD